MWPEPGNPGYLQCFGWGVRMDLNAAGHHFYLKASNASGTHYVSKIENRQYGPGTGWYYVRAGHDVTLFGTQHYGTSGAGTDVDFYCSQLDDNYPNCPH